VSYVLTAVLTLLCLLAHSTEEVDSDDTEFSS